MDKKHKKEQCYQLLFIAFVFIYLIILLMDFSLLSSEAIFFPRIIMAFITILGILKLVSIFIPKLGSIIEPSLSLTSAVTNSFSNISKTKRGKKIDRNNPITIWAWVIVLLISFYLFGFFISIVVGIFILLFLIEKESIIISLTVSFVTITFIYLVFIRIMRMPVFLGFLFK